jgi:curved DNA-binding protein
VIEVQAHPIWTLDGDQLRAELPVAFDELALGGMVKVMTPDGEADVTIPPGTPPGKSLRLRGKGWPGKSGRGDLLLTLDLQWPKQWSDEQRQLLEQLQSSRNGDLRQQWMQNASL